MRLDGDPSSPLLARRGPVQRREAVYPATIAACFLLLIVPGIAFASVAPASPTAATSAALRSSPAGPVTYNVTVFAPALNASLATFYSFAIGSTTFTTSVGNLTVVSGLGVGPHQITNISAGPAAVGWAFEGIALNGSTFNAPGTRLIALSFAYVNLTAAPINLTFRETQLAPSTSWSILLNGTNRNSHVPVINFTGQPGYYECSYHNATDAQGQVQYRTDNNLTFRYYGNSTNISVPFTVWFELAVYGGPGGSVRPNGITWVPFDAPYELYADGSADFYFKSWTGLGLGSYTGEAPQHTITMGSPITEVAVFLPRTNDTGVVRFTENGLPNGSIWTVDVGGVGYSSGLNVLVVPGLIPCATGSSSGIGWYPVTLPPVYANLTTPGLSARYLPSDPPQQFCGSSLPITVNFTVQYLVLAESSAGGAVSATVNASPAAGEYFAPGTVVTYAASPSPGYVFSGWTGWGIASYSGTNPAISVTLSGSIEELASFAAGSGLAAAVFPVTFQVTVGALVSAAWTITFDGQGYAANGSRLTVPNVPNGSHAITVADVLSPDGQSRDQPSTPTFTLTVAGPTLVNLSFAVQYWLNIEVFGPGTVTPGSGWFTAGSTISLHATPGADASFTGWSSTDALGYTGNTSLSATLVVNGPLSESAAFSITSGAPDFWHRSDVLVAGAVGGLLVGFVGVGLYVRYRRRRSRAVPPPAAFFGQGHGPSVEGAVPGGTSDAARPPPPSGLVPIVFLVALLVGCPLLASTGDAIRAAPHPVSLPCVPLAGAQPFGSAAPSPPLAQPADTAGLPATPPKPVAPYSGGPTLSFHESGLPSSLGWTVSVWPYDTGIAAPLTKTTVTSNLALPLPGPEASVDYEVWTVYAPGDAGFVYYGTPTPAGPIDPNVNSSVSVSFTLTNVTAIAYRAHLVESGLPAFQAWQAAVNGVGYNFTQPATDVYLANGTNFTVGALPIVVTADLEYVPSEFAFERFNGSGPWFNTTVSGFGRVVNASAWVAVEYKPYYRVRVVADLGGVATPGNGWYPANQGIVMNATAENGYKFVNWSGSGLGSKNSTNWSIMVTPGSAVLEIASFVAVPYTIEVQETGVPVGEYYSLVYNGAVYSSNRSSFDLPAQTIGNVNVSVPDIASARTVGERFVPVSVTGSFAPGTNATFYVDANGTIELTFATQYALTITVSGPGTTDPEPGGLWEPAGAVRAIRGLPSASGVALEQWHGVGNGSYSGSATGILVVMDGPIAENAQFGPPFAQEGLHLAVSENGLPTGTAWTAEVGEFGATGTTATLTVGPLTPGAVTLTVPIVTISPGERFAPAGGQSLRFGLASNGSVTVDFAAEFAVNISVLFGGSVAAFPPWVPANETITLLANPPLPGYQFNGWTGSTNASGALLTLTVDGPIDLTAQFGRSAPAVTTGPKDLAIAAADIGIPLVAGAVVAVLWFRRRR